MATKRSPFFFHRWLVEQHFGCQKTAYTAKKTRHGPGVTVQLAGKFYRVETLAERYAICQEELSDTYAAFDVPPVLAVMLLDGAEMRPGFMERLAGELKANCEPSFAEARKATLDGMVALQEAMDLPLWTGVASLDLYLLAAALTTLAQLEGPEVLAQRLADLYFAHGHALAVHGEALVVRGHNDGVELLLFEYK